MNKRVIIGIVVIAAILGIILLLVDVIPPKAMTVTAIDETFVRIGMYVRQHNSIPSSLDILPKREGYANRITDGWNRPLQYEVWSNGIIRLTSSGKDGKLGGDGENADITKAYRTKKPDGSLWATSEMWIVEGEITEERPQTNAR
jgi:hypothetical protein